MSLTVSAVFVATATALTLGNVCRALKPLEGRAMGLAYYLTQENLARKTGTARARFIHRISVKTDRPLRSPCTSVVGPL